MKWVATIATVGLATGALTAAPPAPRTARVELDTVVIDKSDRPVRGLHASDFEVREDGELVAVQHVDEVSAIGVADDPIVRSVVLLLDDTRIRATLTPVVRDIARLFLSRARATDAVAVVRLTHMTDPAVGSLEAARDRVEEFRAKSQPYFGIESIEDLLGTVTRISKAVGAAPHRRTAVVCIGARELCDPYFSQPEYSLARRAWRDALTETARANVAVYYVDPNGVSGNADLGHGFVDHTGGAAFVTSNNFERAVDAIWDEAGHYYLLQYESTVRPRDLHSIRVKVRRSDLRVRARPSRGDDSSPLP